MLLIWKLLSETLQEWGFTLNLYDKCVVNKNIEGKQCTIIWHVDDLKVSRRKKEVVEDILKKLTNLDKKNHSQHVGDKFYNTWG